MKSTAVSSNDRSILSDQERKNIQIEINNYLVQYFEKKTGKGISTIKVDLYKEMLLIRIEGFLTDSEKSIAVTPAGIDTIRISRAQAARQNILDNIDILEKKLGAKVFYQTYDIDPEKDFATYLIIFDRILTD